MAEARHEQGDAELLDLFEKFDGLLVSPGGAAHLLGLSRKTIHTLGERGKLRVFRSSEKTGGRVVKGPPRWVYIPLVDVRDYAEQVGRPFPKSPFGMPMDEQS
jgi:hypothetical protein